MQTGTINRSYYRTLILLYLGYFIDFYDLTIFSANYNNVIQDLFHIHNHIAIQELYLKITNFYTMGIIGGGVVFGVIGDRYGRGFAIRQSILLYSISIFLSVFTNSIYVFTILRFISGFGLATEFATSSVLIGELFKHHKAQKTMIAMLYGCGILGGMSATFIGIFSWQIMFLFGSICGFILYFLRKVFVESKEFLNIPATLTRGNIFEVINSRYKITRFLILLSIIIPFYFTISAMFIFPTFMHLKQNSNTSTQTLLICFFLGNLISVFSYNLLSSYIKESHLLIFNTLIFAITTSSFMFVTSKTFVLYYLIIGVVSGSLPAIWISMVTKNYPIHIRNTATNMLYIFGRGSGILFNAIFAILLSHPHYDFIALNIFTISIISVISVFSIFTLTHDC